MPSAARHGPCSFASASSVVSRGCSSLSTTMARPSPAARDRHDLGIEAADFCDATARCCDAQRQRSCRRALDLVVGGDVLGRLGHRVDAVRRLHQRVDEAPADGGVVDSRCARRRRSRPWASRRARGSCSRRRRRSSARPRRRLMARAALPDRVQARAAQAVDRRRRALRRGSPASSAAMRATLRLSSPAWLAQPKITSSTAAIDSGLRSISAESARRRGRRRARRTSAPP